MTVHKRPTLCDGIRVAGEAWLRRWGAPSARALSIALLGIISVVLAANYEQSDEAAPSQASVTISLALAVAVLAATAVLSSLRPPSRVVAIAQPIAEAAVVGTVAVLLTPGVEMEGLITAFLFIPVFVAGQRGGLVSALVAVALGLAPWLSWLVLLGIADGQLWSFLTFRLSGADSSFGRQIQPALLELAAMLMVSLLSEWIRRLRNERALTESGAYADAFRLLSELQHVSRSLSLGLDPGTLANALADELVSLTPGSRTAVAVRGPDGRFSPFTGELDDTDHDVAAQAWSSGTPAVRTEGDAEHRAMPVRMGERVVAVALLTGAHPGPEALTRANEIVRGAGPRLAAALLFDEVRRLATNDERLRLAREIHDGMAQELASMGYVLDDLLTRVDASAAEDIAALRDHVRRVTRDLRLSIFDLRSPVDDRVTLGAALAEHVQRVAASSGVAVRSTIDEQGDRLPTGIEVELLRIAQEALTNVRKHARARTVVVECLVDAPHALLRVMDDGVGLRPARPGSMGIRGMRERAKRIGGELSVGPGPHGGTAVEVHLGDPGHWGERADSPPVTAAAGQTSGQPLPQDRTGASRRRDDDAITVSAARPRVHD